MTTMTLHSMAAMAGRSVAELLSAAETTSTVEQLRDLVRAAGMPIGQGTAALREALATRRKRARRTAPPTVRDWLRADREYRYGLMLRQHGPIPGPAGAGRVCELVLVGPHRLGVEAWSEPGDQSSVPRAYRYRVIDHHVRWRVPTGTLLVTIQGVVTAVRWSDWRSRRPGRATPCAWPVKSRGYSARWVTGYLVRGTHVRAASAAAAERRVARERARRQEALQRQRAELRAATEIWVTRESLRAAGACDPGIEAALPVVARECGVSLGDLRSVGAVRGDVLIRLGYSRWALAGAVRRGRRTAEAAVEAAMDEMRRA